MTDAGTEHNGLTCECECHNGPRIACSIIGGCGLVFEAIHNTPVSADIPGAMRSGPQVNWYAHTIDGEQACIYACTLQDIHAAGCPCQITCPDHEGHCAGCAPRPTHGSSLLCGSCFYRKIRGPLRRVPALFDWLMSRKGARLKAATYDGDRIGGSKETPLPFNPDIVAHLSLMSLLMNAWASKAVGETDPGPGPKVWDAAGSSQWLEQHAGWIAEQRWVVTFAEHLRELEQRARSLAPWQPMRHSLPVPCFRCEQQTLVLFGGEDWVTCTATDCDAVFGWSRYEALSRALGRIYAEEGKAG